MTLIPHSEIIDLSVEWEGPDGIDLFDMYFNPTVFQSESGGLNSLYLIKRKAKWADALTYCGSLDTFTPSELKTAGYYALQAAIFCYSMRPTSIIYVPKEFEKLADHFIEDHENRRRYFREKDLVSILKNRKMLKSAIEFLISKGVLEPTGVDEYAIKRRPINKLKFEE